MRKVAVRGKLNTSRNGCRETTVGPRLYKNNGDSPTAYLVQQFLKVIRVMADSKQVDW